MAKEKEKKVKNDSKHFMKDFKAELKKVVWPTSKQMISNVTAVISIVLITAAIVIVLDCIFNSINEYGLKKLKTNIQAKEQSQTQVIDNTSAEQQTNNNTENSEQANNQNTENNDSAQNVTE